MPTILVADDNSNIQKMVSLVFEEKGIRVVAVGNGEAACRKVPEVRPDIVLADVFMPVRNGYEVCEFVKQSSEFAHIPVILLVGAFDPLDEKEAHRVGANGVLKKPFVPPDPLIAMVTSLLPKIEPAAVQAAPPKEEVPEPPAWMPKPRPPIPEFEEPEGVPPEFAFGTTASKDFEPIATPTARHAGEESDQEEEPVNEWTRRRKTLEYEIPASESASLVEKLAGGKMTPDDSETLETSVHSKAHVTFGGANVPEKVESSATGARTKWMDLMGIAESAPADLDVEEGHATSPAQEEPASSTVSSEPSNGALNKYALKKNEDVPSYAPHEEAPRRKDSAPENAVAQQTEWPAPPAEVIPFPAPVESSSTSAASHTPEETISAEPILEETADAAPSYTVEDISAALAEADNAPSKGHYEVADEAPDEALAAEISAPESAAHAEIPEKSDGAVMETAHPASTEKAVAEAVAAMTAKNAQMDAAAIDSVVAKLLEKLEPQIHEALSNGLLRPLVEEILNRERHKK